MKTIPLSGKHGLGKFAMVDDKDYEAIRHYKWHARKDKCGNFYPCTKTKNKSVLMHRMIMGVVDKTILVDHKDFNTLNNQRVNLRLATRAQNNRNTKSRIGSSSNYLGVYKKKWSSGQHKWAAKIRFNGKSIHIGYFEYSGAGEEMAARAYDKKAKEIFGEFANLNFK